MPKGKARFSNQKKKALLKHLDNLLLDEKLYNLSADPLGIYFDIRESRKAPKEMSEKRQRIKKEYQDSSKKKRKLSGTRRRTSPKIRNAKKGRTVNLKGVSY